MAWRRAIGEPMISAAMNQLSRRLVSIVWSAILGRNLVWLLCGRENLQDQIKGTRPRDSRMKPMKGRVLVSKSREHRPKSFV